MEKEKRQIKPKEKENKQGKKLSIKKYLRDFLVFADKKLIRAIGILFVIAVLLIAITISSMVAAAKITECEGMCVDEITIFNDYVSKLQILLITLVAGIAPYTYIGVIGFFCYVISEVTSLAYLIKDYGYFAGIGLGIVPLVLNILTICITTSLAIYICRTVTVGYKISNIKNMNFTNFRIKFYEVLKMEDKVKALTKKKEDKLKKLENKKEKLNYLQILNVSMIVCIIQFISVLIQHILV